MTDRPRAARMAIATVLTLVLVLAMVTLAGASPGKGKPGKGSAGSDGILEADEVARVVVEGLRAEEFLILPHPEVATYEQRRAGDRERWLKGMRRAQAAMVAAWRAAGAEPPG